MRRSAVFIIISALLLFPASALAQDTVRIGLTLGLTGRYAEMSGMQEKGFRLWAKEVNEKGGLLGHPVELIIYNDDSDPETAAKKYEKLISTDKVDLLFGPYSSGITAAVLPVTEKHRYPLIITGASSDALWEKGYTGAFGMYSSASKYTVGFLEMLVLNGISKLAIIFADDSFSTNTARGTKEWAERFGLEVIKYEEFPKAESNLDSYILGARNAGAEVVIVSGHFNESLEMARSLARIRWSPIASYASVGPALTRFGEILGAKAEGIFSSSQWESACALCPPPFRDFADRFLTSYGQKPSYHAAAAFAGGQVVEEVLSKTKSLDREKFKKAMYSLDTTTLLGRFGVDSRGMQVRHFPLIIQWQKGSKEIVWPKDLRTAEPVLNLKSSLAR